MVKKKILAETMAVIIGILMLGCGNTPPAGKEDSWLESSAAESVELVGNTENGEKGSTANAKNDDSVTAAESSLSSAEPVELVVFAAASMTETLSEIAGMYSEIAPNVTLVYNFDSSGTLKTQIEEGADCDIFISAAEKQMNDLDASFSENKQTDDSDASFAAGNGSEEKPNFVLQGTRTDILENRVTLTVPEGNPSGVKSFEQLAEGLKDGSIMLAMGNADVPVGQYTLKILAYYGLDEEELSGAGVITYGSNVKEVTTQVSEAAVDCGIIYATDAFSAGLDVVDTASEEMCGKVIYPAAVLNVTRHEAEAKAFLEYLTGADAAAVFESVGFTPLS